jgi:hypothetical protein
MKITVFWDVTSCYLMDRYRSFEEICCIRLQVKRKPAPENDGRGVEKEVRERGWRTANGRWYL